MNDIRMYQTMFERYIDDKIDEEHFDNFVESLGAPSFLGCRINLNRGKTEKKTNTKKEVVEDVNKAIAIFNSNIAMTKKLDDEVFGTINDMLNLDEDSNSKDAWKYLKVKTIDGSIKNNQYVTFLCYAEPTFGFYKSMASVNKTKNNGKISFIINIKIPLVSDEINDTYLNTEFCHVSAKKK